VAYGDRSGKVGRPKRIWRLTARGHARFPDTHGDLTVSLEGIRLVFGTAGLDRLIQVREDTMVISYRHVLEPLADLSDRVRALARLRTMEGYMAQARRQRGETARSR
jgi:predicted ArsR family transcriptional regulator